MRSLSALLLVPLLACAGGAPLEGDWSGSMEVSFLDDVRTFSIDVTGLERKTLCADAPDDPECYTLLWEGDWDLYVGTVDYGGDAALTGDFFLNHCVGSDCVADTVPVEAGYVNMGSSWDDGQIIGLIADVKPEADVEKLSGTANYWYTGGGMVGTYELKRN